MVTPKQASDFCREYDLAEARRHGVSKSPAPHQAEALQDLDKWYKSAPNGASWWNPRPSDRGR
jgi:hypothetical protein